MSKQIDNRYPFEPDYAVPPGVTLQETIDALGMDQRELAVRTGLAPKTINQIIKGHAPITHQTAVVLERVTGIPARLWNNLESNYREQLAKIEDRQTLENDLGFLRNIPVKELINRGAIENKTDKAALLKDVFHFFGVKNRKAWEDVWLSPSAAYRKSQCFESQPEAVAAWLRLGELAAQKIECGPYNKQTFRTALNEIRKLTVHDPNAYIPRMVELCAKSGVAVVFIREIKKCPMSGVARWLTPNKALIQLSLRYKTNDQFWFSFFHEAGHIISHGKKSVFLEDMKDNYEEEKEANQFAANILIDPEIFQDFCRKHNTYSKLTIHDFALSIGIAPGIVVGRLQHDKKLPHNHCNDLREKFAWADEAMR